MISLYAIDSKEESVIYLTQEEALANSAPEDGITELVLLQDPLDALISLLNNGGFEAARKIIREPKW